MQAESVCGSGCSGAGAITAFKYSGHTLGIAQPLTDLKKRACENPHHVIQKAVAGEYYAKFIAAAHKFYRAEISYGGLFHVFV